MEQRKANLYRLYPTAEQARQMVSFAGACRFVYNLALEQRSNWWRQYRANTGQSISYISQANELPALRAEVDWIQAAPAQALQQVLKDLDRAYRNFFAGRAQYPTRRKRGVNDSFRFPDPKQFSIRRIGKHTGILKLPKLGNVRLRGWQSIPGDIANVTVTRRAGKWFAAVQWEREVAEPLLAIGPAVGIDLGVAAFAAMSDGTLIAPANAGKMALRVLRRAQKKLSRKKRGSKNRRKAAARVARLQERVANTRKDFLHKHSTAIAKSHGVVVMEDLAVRNMSASAKGTVESPGRHVRQKAGLNRSILDQGWGMFRTMLDYKLAERGGRLILVPPAYTSQTCSCCGVVDSGSRRDQARFVCVACGHQANADVNAAINILRRAGSPSLPVEAARQRACEAGTTRRAA